METPNKRPGAAVDDILDEIKGRGRTGAPKRDAGSLDDILAELGTGKREGTPPAQRPGPSSARASSGAGRQAAAPRKAPSAAPQSARQAALPPQKAPQPTPEPQAEKTENTPENLFDTGTRRPVGMGSTTILDINPEHTTGMQRVGKAAALDKVDHDKYAGDEELLSWFSGGSEEPQLSKKEMRRLEKERKKQEAADKKDRKRREKLGEPAEETYPEDEALFKLQASTEPPAEAPAPAPGPRRAAPTPQQDLEKTFELDVVPSSAFKQRETANTAEAPAPAPQRQQTPTRQQPTAAERAMAIDRAMEQATAAEQGKPESPAAPAPNPLTKTQKLRQPISPPVQRPTPKQAQTLPASPAPDSELELFDKQQDMPLETPRPAPKQSVAPTQPVPKRDTADGFDLFSGEGEKPKRTEARAPKTSTASAAGNAAKAVAAAGAAATTVVAAGTAKATAAPVAAAPGPKAVSEPTLGFSARGGSTQQVPVQKPADASEKPGLTDTQTYDIEPDGEEPKIPTAAFTQEFDKEDVKPDEPHTSARQLDEEREGKSLFLDEMVDDRFRAFFGETVIVEKEDMELASRARRRTRKQKTSRLFTGEFAQLAQQVEEDEAAAAEETAPGGIQTEYNRPQDAETVQNELQALRKNLLIRCITTGVIAVLLLLLSLGYSEILTLPGFMSPLLQPLVFSLTNLVLVTAAICINFTTIASGLVGLAGQPTVDSAPALAAVATLLQAVVLTVQLTTGDAARATLFGPVAALLLLTNAFGKHLRAKTILENFSLASAGFDHSAAYIVDDTHELSYSITDGLAEEEPTLLISRPTALVKGFLRQSFSERWSDGIGRILGWVLGGLALVVAVIAYIVSKDLLITLSAMAGALCIAAPLSSTLLSAIPSLLMQQANSKVGAVVPGWSAIEELGNVNVVMAGARDIFPPTSVQLRGIKTFEKERIDVAILYAASVLIEGCDTLKDIFLGVIQGKHDMLYKVESLTKEPGKGFTAWVENHRIVIGTREMMQRHDIVPPSIEAEMKYTTDGCVPVYLAVSGKLFAMFVIRYRPDEEVRETLAGFVRSGLSLLVTSDDMNITKELIEEQYALPPGVVKVLGRRELDLLEPLTAYLPESEGVMTHIGTFTSFIGGMRSAAECAASERMSTIIQAVSAGLAAVLGLVLALNSGLATLSLSIVLLYQLCWTVGVCGWPLFRKY